MKVDRDHRRACRLHMLRRLRERGLPMSVMGLRRLERRIERCRGAYASHDQRRYRLTLIIGRARAVVIYDTELRCLVTLLSIRPYGGRHG